jgi:hypothetical protein
MILNLSFIGFSVEFFKIIVDSAIDFVSVKLPFALQGLREENPLKCKVQNKDLQSVQRITKPGVYIFYTLLI